jgi:hypothetical protein
MTRRKHDPKKYKRTKNGDPVTDKWTVREVTRKGKKRDVLIRKNNKKREIKVIYDERMSPIISFTGAKKMHNKRKKSAKNRDRNATHKNTKSFADKSWGKNPGRSDVKGIDTKK